MSKQDPTPSEVLAAREHAEALSAEYRRIKQLPDDPRGYSDLEVRNAEIRRLHAARAAAAEARAAFYRITTPLPLPWRLGGPELTFGEAVDNYAAAHGVTRAETFRRISDVTGNSTGTLARRYSDRGNSEWWSGWGMGHFEPTHRDPPALSPLDGED